MFSWFSFILSLLCSGSEFLNFWISCLPQGGIKIFLFIFLLIFKTKLHRTMCNDCAVTEALIASTKHNVWKEVDFRNFRVRILPTRQPTGKTYC